MGSLGPGLSFVVFQNSQGKIKYDLDTPLCILVKTDIKLGLLCIFGCHSGEVHSFPFLGNKTGKPRPSNGPSMTQAPSSALSVSQDQRVIHHSNCVASPIQQAFGVTKPIQCPIHVPSPIQCSVCVTGPIHDSMGVTGSIQCTICVARPVHCNICVRWPLVLRGPSNEPTVSQVPSSKPPVSS